MRLVRLLSYRTYLLVERVSEVAKETHICQPIARV